MWLIFSKFHILSECGSDVHILSFKIVQDLMYGFELILNKLEIAFDGSVDNLNSKKIVFAKFHK
jgi:hypothetical protein